MSVLLTGFGPFGDFDVNPSQIVALAAKDAGLVANIDILPTVYAECEGWAQRNLGPGQTVVHLGVAAEAESFRLERMARNVCGGRPDANGGTWPSGEVMPGPETIETTVDVEGVREACGDLPVVISEDAGDYLCNFTFYRSLRRGDATVLFVHIPKLRDDLDLHLLVVSRIVGALQRSAT